MMKSMSDTCPTNKHRFNGFLRRFLRREDGLITIESMMILPLLLWSVFASYTYFDSYRQSTLNIKAAYAVADIISRERGALNENYIDTMHELMETMVSTRAPVSMRVSYLIYDEDTELHNVEWSCIRGETYKKQWTSADIAQIKDYLPDMPDNGSMIVVETNNTYRAPFNIGFDFDNFSMGNFVFTHPRVFDNIRNDDPNCQVT